MGKENQFITSASTKFPEELKGLKNVEVLSKFQHYGWPTRPLDVTSNPLVALYFACVNDSNDDGYVYFFAPDETLKYDSDRGAMLASLAKVNSKEFIEINEYIKEAKRKLFDKLTKDETFNLTYLENYIYEIAQDKPSFNFNHRIIPYDLWKSHFIKPSIVTERAKAQDGLFIIRGLGDDVIDKSTYNFKFTIQAKYKSKILEELKLIGISHSKLFPELEEGFKDLD